MFLRRPPAPLLGMLLLAPLLGCAPDDTEEKLLQIRRAEDLRTTAGDTLQTLLRDSSPTVRANAARALGRIGDPVALPDLIRALRDDRMAEVRREAAFALGILGHADAVEPLAGRLDHELDITALEEIALAVGRIGQSGTAHLLHPLLDSRYATLRESVAEALALLADSTSIDPLVKALDDPVESVTWKVAYALEKIPGDRQVPRLMGLLRSSSPALRRAAVRSLGRLEAPQASGAIADLYHEGSDWRLRVRVADALGRIGDPKTAPTLGAMAGDENFHVRESALVAIARMQASELLPTVLTARRDAVVDVRMAAYDACAALLGEEAFDVLSRGIHDESPLVASTALGHLGGCDDEQVVGVLLEQLESSRRPGMRAAATVALGAAGERAPRSVLRSLVGDEDWVVASQAARALGRLDDAEAIDVLLAALEREGPGAADVHLAAVESLGALADRRAVPSLRGVLSRSGDTRLRLAARDALETLLQPSEAAHLPSEAEIRFDVRPVERDPAQPALVVHSQARQLVLHTPRGRIVIDLFRDEAPQMVESFARLAEDGFFDGLIFHRVVPDFVIQGGDPRGTGWGDAGYTLRSEWNPLHFERGRVGIAHSGKDTGSCQLFITQSPQPHLDARYTIFGEVVSGMSAVDAVQSGDQFRAEVLWLED